MRRALLLPALLVFVAGCLGSPGVGPVATNATPTASPPPGTTPENTIAFANLSATERAAFRDAIDGEVVFTPNASYPDYSRPTHEYAARYAFEYHRYVRYEGRYYRIELEDRGPGPMAHTIEMGEVDPAPNDTAITFEDVPANLREEVRTAVESGSYRSPAGRWGGVPGVFARLSADDRHLRYENGTYTVTSITTSDLPVYVLNVTDVGRDD